MAHIFSDMVAESSTTTGTGALTVAGALTGHKAFSAVMAVGDRCHYSIIGVDGSGVPTGEWETGLGTYSASNTLTRTEVYASSNSNAAVNLSAGTKRVLMSFQAADVQRIGVFSPPRAADFSLANSDGTNLTLANDDVGMQIDSGAPAASSGVRYAYKTLTTPASDWDMKMRFKAYMLPNNFTSIGLIAFNSSNGRHVRWVSQSNTPLTFQKYSTITTFSTQTTSTPVAGFVFEALRLRSDGTTLSADISHDGEHWMNYTSEALATFLTASGGTVDRVGIVISVQRTTGPNQYMTVPYFDLSGGAV